MMDNPGREPTPGVVTAGSDEPIDPTDLLDGERTDEIPVPETPEDFWDNLPDEGEHLAPSRRWMTVLKLLAALGVLVIGFVVARTVFSDEAESTEYQADPAAYIPETVQGDLVFVADRRLSQFVERFELDAALPAGTTLASGLVGDPERSLPDLLLLIGGVDGAPASSYERQRDALLDLASGVVVEEIVSRSIPATLVQLDNSGAPPGFDLWAGLAVPRDDVVVLVVSFTGRTGVKAGLDAALVAGRTPAETEAI